MAGAHPADTRGGWCGRVFAQCARPGGAKRDKSASVPERVDVVVEADRRAGRPAERTAALTAAAALDPHDVSVEALSVGAVETKPHGAGEGRRAAAVVGAAPTGARAVQLSCGASGEGDPYWLFGPNGPLTLFPLLDDYGKLRLTLSDLAEPGFPDQPTVGVVVGHSTRNAHPARRGALRPLCGLWETAVLEKHLRHGEGHHLSE